MNEGMADCGKASNGRYVSQKCRCDKCRAAHRAAYHARRQRNKTGQTYFVDAGPVREKLDRLYAAGYGVKELNRMGVPDSTQRALMYAHQRTGRPIKHVKREIALRIDEIAGRDLAPAQVIPGDAAVYLVRRWADSGVSVAVISRETGINRQTLDALRHGRRTRVKAKTLEVLLEHRERLDRLSTAKYGSIHKVGA